MTAIAAREHVLRCRGLSEAWTADDKRYTDVLERVRDNAARVRPTPQTLSI